MSLLCRLAGPKPCQLASLVTPCVRVGTVPVRFSSQKKTVEKYGAKAAKSGKNKGDFLSRARHGETDKKKTKAATSTTTTTVDINKPKQEKALSEAQLALLDDNSTNIMFDFPDLTVTQQRYEEYEKGEADYQVQELVSEDELAKEREDTIKRLWEPYETETFNLKALIGDATAKDEMAPHEIHEERPSKILYYTDEELSRYLPEGVAGKLKEFSRPGFVKKGVLVRPVAEDVIAWLEEWRQRKFVGRRRDRDFYTLLNGPAGAGKSCLLNPIVHWARMAGWLVVFVPDGKDWAGYPKKGQGVTKKLSYSKINEAWFGQPYIATKWITSLLQAHGDKLGTITLRTTFTVHDVDPDKSKFYSSPEKTLKDLLEYGLTQPDQASDCVYYFRQELCCVTEFPVLIVVDAVNSLRNPSFYGDPIDPYVFAPNLDGSRLVLARAFQDFRNHGLINGMYVGTVCHSASRRSLSVKVPDPDMKRQKYKLDSRLALTHVPPLSRAEAHQLAAVYRENRVLTDEVPSQTVDYMWIMSEGNGDEFWKQAEFI
eukprot:Phypoly_transcript_06943.p1 GENE.Phypoly_transcript_06943~~Phypoly_transcript_06943.p1  ORF type:complete len:542 (+),score=90.09 Phypoly_transcript_06943:63-1688(+)